MRTEQAHAKKESRNRLVGPALGLALLVGAFSSMGSAPTKHATSSSEAAMIGTGASASTTRDGISLREAIADRDTLDLQLD